MNIIMSAINIVNTITTAATIHIVVNKQFEIMLIIQAVIKNYLSLQMGIQMIMTPVIIAMVDYMKLI